MVKQLKTFGSIGDSDMRAAASCQVFSLSPYIQTCLGISGTVVRDKDGQHFPLPGCFRAFDQSGDAQFHFGIRRDSVLDGILHKSLEKKGRYCLQQGLLLSENLILEMVRVADLHNGQIVTQMIQFLSKLHTGNITLENVPQITGCDLA